MVMIDQGAGIRVKIAARAREPTIAKTRNPRTIARTTVGILAHDLAIEEARDGD
jgi:hypothetical protein